MTDMGNVTVKPQITDEMVEAGAREMVTAWCYAPEGTKDWERHWRINQTQYRKQARAAITAALSVPCLQEPVGWRWRRNRWPENDYIVQRVRPQPLNVELDKVTIVPLYAQPIEVREQAIRECAEIAESWKKTAENLGQIESVSMAMDIHSAILALLEGR